MVMKVLGLLAIRDLHRQRSKECERGGGSCVSEVA
jgi:hypothetical protein